jgi:hypothetical protein
MILAWAARQISSETMASSGMTTLTTSPAGRFRWARDPARTTRAVRFQVITPT